MSAIRNGWGLRALGKSKMKFVDTESADLVFPAGWPAGQPARPPGRPPAARPAGISFLCAQENNAVPEQGNLI